MTMGPFPLGNSSNRRSIFIPRQGASGILASGWADNANKVTLAQSTAVTTVTSVTVTPKVSGKLRVEVSGAVVNILGTLQDANLWLARAAGTAPASADYTVMNAFPIDGTNIADAESFATVVRYDIAAVGPLPLVFPVGAPVTFFLLGNASAGSSMVIPAHGAQIDVLEVR